jgi:hypothetical protein
MTDAHMAKALEQLAAYYRAHGCACRFPRAREALARDTHEIAGGSFSSRDRDFLVWPVERSMTIVNKRDEINRWTGNCADCGARVERFANEYANGGWIEYLVIWPGPDATELGADVGPHPFRCKPLWAPGPRMGGQEETEKTFPLVSENEWLDWMRELRILGPGQDGGGDE